MNERGRPRKYLTVERFEAWLNNHWRHMVWKVNGLIAGGVVVIGLLVAILCAILTIIFRG